MGSLAAGTVGSIFRWPVKSFGGEEVDALRIDGRGAGGDRTYALWETDRNRLLTARQAPGMLRWRAAYPDHPGDALDPADPPEPTVTGPDGTVYAWTDPALVARLNADLGRCVALRADASGQQDLERSLLLTTQGSLDALSAELGDGPVDLRRFRTNVHMSLDADPFAEEYGWEGGLLRIGDAALEILHPCARCVIPTRDPATTEKNPLILRHLARTHGTLFGINVRPLHPATIRRGDNVTVEPPA